MSDEDKILSKSARSVQQQALIEKGLAFEVVELSASSRTAIDAANIGCSVASWYNALGTSHDKKYYKQFSSRIF